MDKKILMLGWGYPPDIEGGLDIHVSRLFEELQNFEFDVDLALPEQNAPDRENVIGLEMPDDDMKFQARKMSEKIVKLAEDYDIIHTHDWFGSEAGFKAKKYSDVKWVSTFHSLSSDRTSLPSDDIERLEKTGLEADRSTAVSDLLADKIQQEYGSRPEVVPNGFSEPESTGRDIKSHSSIEGNMIFYVGRHAEQKGIELLIYAFNKLDEDATLVLGGNGHMTEALKNFSEMLGIEEDVIFTGFIPDEQLGDYYCAADVFVSPSISEPFGLTITEAVSCGTPVVATENGAVEILPDEAVVNVEQNSDSIADGIQKALQKEDVEIDVSRNWKDVAEDIAEVYREIF
jgi:glycosyltransferase involved in cell wall biosynthesis